MTQERGAGALHRRKVHARHGGQGEGDKLMRRDEAVLAEPFRADAQGVAREGGKGGVGL